MNNKCYFFGFFILWLLILTSCNKMDEYEKKRYQKDIENKNEISNNLSLNFVNFDSNTKSEFGHINISLTNYSRFVLKSIAIDYSLFSNGINVYNSSYYRKPLLNQIAQLILGKNAKSLFSINWSIESEPFTIQTLMDRVKKSDDVYYKLKTSTNITIKINEVFINKYVEDDISKEHYSLLKNNISTITDKLKFSYVKTIDLEDYNNQLTRVTILNVNNQSGYGIKNLTLNYGLINSNNFIFYYGITDLLYKYRGGKTIGPCESGNYVLLDKNNYVLNELSINNEIIGINIKNVVINDISFTEKPTDCNTYRQIYQMILNNLEIEFDKFYNNIDKENGYLSFSVKNKSEYSISSVYLYCKIYDQNIVILDSSIHGVHFGKENATLAWEDTQIPPESTVCRVVKISKQTEEFNLLNNSKNLNCDIELIIIDKFEKPTDNEAELQQFKEFFTDEPDEKISDIHFFRGTVLAKKGKLDFAKKHFLKSKDLNNFKKIPENCVDECIIVINNALNNEVNVDFIKCIFDKFVYLDNDLLFAPNFSKDCQNLDTEYSKFRNATITLDQEEILRVKKERSQYLSIKNEIEDNILISFLSTSKEYLIDNEADLLLYFTVENNSNYTILSIEFDYSVYYHGKKMFTTDNCVSLYKCITHVSDTQLGKGKSSILFDLITVDNPYYYTLASADKSCIAVKVEKKVTCEFMINDYIKVDASKWW